MSLKKLIGLIVALVFAGIAGGATYVIVLSSNLPKLITVQDYEPLLVSEVYDRENQKIGEFFREKRILTPFPEIPKVVTQAFISAEDDTFFEHGGINYMAIIRALIANLKAGRKVQGGSTITQQVARSLLLSREKTYDRKIKEAILAYRMEANLTKEEILYLYLNQIYLGQGAYGVGAAAEIYFRKPVKDITVAEAALLAGLPQAPSRYSPIYNPSSAKARQKYVLERMAEEGYITQEDSKKAIESPLKVYVRENYIEMAPFYLETIRQMLVKRLGEEMVLDKGIKVYTGLDLKKQLEAQKQVRQGLRDLDKRQGYRGPLKNLQDTKEIADFLLKTRDALMEEYSPIRIINPDGTIRDKRPLNLTGKDAKGQPIPNIPDYIKVDQMVQGLITNVDDATGLVYVRFAESKGLIDIETMKWARHPDPNVRGDWAELKKPSQALKKGDVILARVAAKTFASERLQKEIDQAKKKAKGKKLEVPLDLPKFDDYAKLELEQEPVAEASLVSFDQKTAEIVAMVGGYDFTRSQFNRAIQAARQTGSAFKTIVYAAALDKGFTPATPIIDAPIVYEELKENPESHIEEVKTWKPTNHSQKFIGDILFRNALVKSLNVPTVKIIEKIGVPWVVDYSRRLGIFSPLNMDFTLSLGSSSVTLYEMTKVFSQFGRMGVRIRPLMIHKVVDRSGQVLAENITLDERFEAEMKPIEEEFTKRREGFLAYAKDHPEVWSVAKPVSGEGESQPKPEDDEGDSNEESEPDLAEAAKKKDEIKPETVVLAPGQKDPRKEPPLFFGEEDQLLRPATAYVTTTLLQGVIDEPGGTGGAARSLGRPVAGKTGTTSSYYDAWFIGYTANIATGVWVGFDEEKSLGKGEVGGKAALPIWLEYMKYAHEGIPATPFRVPDGIVFANIDNETGKLASASSKDVIRQAFLEGTEPTQTTDEAKQKEDRNFYKEDLSE